MITHSMALKLRRTIKKARRWLEGMALIIVSIACGCRPPLLNTFVPKTRLAAVTLNTRGTTWRQELDERRPQRDYRCRLRRCSHG